MAANIEPEYLWNKHIEREAESGEEYDNETLSIMRDAFYAAVLLVQEELSDWLDESMKAFERDCKKIMVDRGEMEP